MTLTGTITGKEGIYYTIQCPNAPLHLRRLLLRSEDFDWMIRNYKVGDKVLVQYQTGINYAFWQVIQIIKDV